MIIIIIINHNDSSINYMAYIHNNNNDNVDEEEINMMIRIFSERASSKILWRMFKMRSTRHPRTCSDWNLEGGTRW